MQSPERTGTRDLCTTGVEHKTCFSFVTRRFHKEIIRSLKYAHVNYTEMLEIDAKVGFRRVRKIAERYY